MDGSRLDALARSLTSEQSSRRLAIGGLAAALISTVAIADAGAKKKKRCKRKKRCGKDCCNGSSCFAKSVNDENGETLSLGCCPASSSCKSVLPNWQDQCCYADETCDPQLPVRDIFADSICCRPCGDSCLSSSFECVSGAPVFLQTARLPRHRR